MSCNKYVFVYNYEWALPNETQLCVLFPMVTIATTDYCSCLLMTMILTSDMCCFSTITVSGYSVHQGLFFAAKVHPYCECYLRQVASRVNQETMNQLVCYLRTKYATNVFFVIKKILKYLK